MTGTSGTYVYCVVWSRGRAPRAKPPAGPPGTRRARLLEIRPGRYLVVSDAPLGTFGEAPLATHLADLEWVSRAAVAHDAVIEAFTTADAVLPMKLFTIFTSDERAIAQARSDWKRIDRGLRRVAGSVEWGIRLMYDERKAPAKRAAPRAASGRGYLLAKRQQHTTTVAQTRALRTQTTALLDSLARIARDVRRRPITAPARGGSSMLLDAAFLVPRTRQPRFRAAVERRARALAPHGLAVHLSGPWPPYSFIEPD